MEEIKLDVHVRNRIGTREVKKLRREDAIPGVVYGGGKKKPPTVIQVKRGEYEKIMRHHRGQSVVFHLNVLENGKKLKDYSAIVKKEQLHPVRESVLHLDFQRISLTEEIEVQVQVELKGDPVGVKRDGGSLEHGLWELDIICLPTNIPEKIVVDVSHLEIGDAIHVENLNLPAGVKTKHDPESIVATVVPPMKEEEEAPAEGVEGPEVIGEKKEGAEGSEEKPEEKGEKDKGRSSEEKKSE